MSSAAAEPDAPTGDRRPTRRVAVIGGGLAGLAAAHRLLELSAARQPPLELTLFEAGTRLGGVMGTREVDGYRVETGADSFITNKPWGINLCKRLGLEDRLIPTDVTYRRSLVLRQGRPVEVPEGFQLLTPVQVLPVLLSPIFSPWGKLRMGLEYFLPRGGTGGDESLAHFVRRRFGQECLERLVQPLVGGIYTSDPEKLSLRATMSRFLEMEEAEGSLIRALRKQARAARRPEEVATGARYGLFATLQHGISELLDALADRVRAAADVQLRASVTALAPLPEGAGYRLRVDYGPHGAPADFEVDGVVVAVPAWRAAELLREAAPAAVAPLQGIEYASTAIVVTGHRLADITHPLDAFGLVVPAIEQRKILAVSFTSRKFPERAPEGRVQLRTFVGGAMQPELLELSDEELVRLVREELREILGVQGEPDFAIVARWSRAMPQYHVGHLDRVAAIEAALAERASLALAGNAYHGVGIPDVIHSGELAAERVLGGGA